MAPGEQIAFEPALAHVLAEHFHHAAVRAKMCRPSARFPSMKILSVTSNRASRRFDAVSSGPKTRKFFGVGVELHHIAQKSPMYARRFRDRRRPAWGPERRNRGSRASADRFSSSPAVGVRIGAHAARRPWAQVRPIPESVCRSRRTAPRAGSSSSILPASSNARAWSRVPRAAPGARAMSLRMGIPSTTLGPVQPFGRAQDDHRPARAMSSLSCGAPRAGCREFRRE